MRFPKVKKRGICITIAAELITKIYVYREYRFYNTGEKLTLIVMKIYMLMKLLQESIILVI
mgnify:CR=1 FL=1